MEVEQVSNLLNAVARPISLETPVGESEETTLLDLLQEEEDLEFLKEIELEHLLSVLNEKEREVIRLRYGLGGTDPLTLDEVAQRMQLSRERVRQLEARAIKKMRKAAGS
jgi:RNA polymerase primary sigma factor